MDNSLPRALGPYRLLRSLGQGGMGAVYLARREAEGGVALTCVVKTIRPSYSESRDYERMFLREAKIHASLRHQNIVQIVDFGRAGDELYLAMEYLDGEDLQQILARLRARDERVPLRVALLIAVEILRGLDYLHRRTDEQGRPLHIIHRDLSANNIFLTREGEVKIMDLGLAKSALLDSVTREHKIKGKLGYMAAEAVEPPYEVDQRVDLFAMGVILYEMVTGARPFQADSPSNLVARIVRGHFTPASQQVEVPSELDRLLDRALARDRAARFASAAEMLTAVEDLLVQLPRARVHELRSFCRDWMGQTPSPMPREVAEPRHEGATVSHAVKQEPPPRRERRSWLIPILIGVFTLVALGFLYTTWQGTWWPTSTSETPTVAETPTPEPAATPAALPPAPVAPVVAATPATKPKPEAKKTEATPAPAPTPVAPESDGYLTVADLQPYAEVYVDGAYKDTTPAGKIPLAPGKHTVKLVNPQAGKSAVLTVEILPGKKFFITKWPQ